MDFEENMDKIIVKTEFNSEEENGESLKHLEIENNENDYNIINNLVYYKNELLIARIVYQCYHCIHVFNTIKDSNNHYIKFHTNNNNNKNLNNNQIIEKIDSNPKQIEENFLKKKLREKFNEIKRKKKKFKSLKPIKTEINKSENIIRNKSFKKRKTDSKIGEKGLYKITGKLFKCDECGKSYATQKILNTHNRMHTNPVECPFLQCGRKFPFMSLMKIHYLVHTNESRFKAGIIAHKRTHTGEKPYKCCYPQCYKEFTQQSSLNSHISYKHNKEIVKRFDCEWPGCEARFVFLNQLKKHHRSHTGERPFACDWPHCEMKFANSTVLKRHRVTHTGERPYPCDWPGCEARFGASGTLNTHKKLIHKCDYIRRSRWDNKKNKS